MGGGDPPGQVRRRAGRSVALRAAVPFEEVRIEGLERAEESDRGVDEPAEEDRTEAEVGRTLHRTRRIRAAVPRRADDPTPSRSWR